VLSSELLTAYASAIEGASIPNLSLGTAPVSAKYEA
jgi:hypothetical protein